jgi:hypothetical protein
MIRDFLRRHFISFVFIFICILFIMYYTNDKNYLLQHISRDGLAKKNNKTDQIIGNKRG